jgi:hypothetical protein
MTTFGIVEHMQVSSGKIREIYLRQMKEDESKAPGLTANSI